MRIRYTALDENSFSEEMRNEVERPEEMALSPGSKAMRQSASPSEKLPKIWLLRKLDTSGEVNFHAGDLPQPSSK